MLGVGTRHDQNEGFVRGKDLPLPYGYCVFLRLAIRAGALLLAMAEYQDHGVSVWALAFGALALPFNPIIPACLTRDIRAPIDVGAALLVGARYWFGKRGTHR